MEKNLLIGIGGAGGRIADNFVCNLKEMCGDAYKKNTRVVVIDVLTDDAVADAFANANAERIWVDSNVSSLEDLRNNPKHDVFDWYPENRLSFSESDDVISNLTRYKSRLLFLNMVENGKIFELEDVINSMMDDTEENIFNVAVALNSAGRFSSGVAIQLALWLRSFFKKRKCKLTLKGFFVLPDIYVNSVKEIRTNQELKKDLYSNTYAMAMELYALDKIMLKGAEKPELKLDGFFETKAKCNTGVGVYDYVHFISDTNENGSMITSLDEYEKIASNIIYTHMFSPARESVTFFEGSISKILSKYENPLYSSCGVARAVYPTEDIVEYCALRATDEMLSDEWVVIDRNINCLIKKGKDINPRDEFIREYESRCLRERQNEGNGGLFADIAVEAFNEMIDGDNDKKTIGLTDKVDDFIHLFDEVIARNIDERFSHELLSCKINRHFLENNYIEECERIVYMKKNNLDVLLTEFENNVESLANDIVNSICPTYMSDLCVKDDSVFGLFTKKSRDGKTQYVHPLTVRYLLNRLIYSLKQIMLCSDCERLRDAVNKGYGFGYLKVFFDNRKTKAYENSPTEYLKSKKTLQRTSKFIKKFAELYEQYSDNVYNLSRYYMIELLKSNVVFELLHRIEGILKETEELFCGLSSIDSSIKQLIDENIIKNKNYTGKTIFVHASKDEKEAMYKEMRLDSSISESDFNKTLATAIYHNFCVEYKNDVENTEQPVKSLFLTSATSLYKNKIHNDRQEVFDFDIYSAVCQEALFNNGKDRVVIDDVLEDDEDSKRFIQMQAWNELARKLSYMSAPLINCEEDSVSLSNRKYFRTWGINCDVEKRYENIQEPLDSNVNIKLLDYGFAKNELICHSVLYGIALDSITGFNNATNGQYYESYLELIEDMNAEYNSGKHDALKNTPHLDKAWHEILFENTNENK